MLSKKSNLHGFVIYLAKILLTTLFLTAGGCGQSGDLSLPDNEEKVVQ